MTQSVILRARDEPVRVFAVLDDAIFYIKEDDDDL